jgi:hypothetical protein
MRCSESFKVVLPDWTLRAGGNVFIQASEVPPRKSSLKFVEKCFVETEKRRFNPTKPVPLCLN